jgi:hypothetical protein
MWLTTVSASVHVHRPSRALMVGSYCRTSANMQMFSPSELGLFYRASGQLQALPAVSALHYGVQASTVEHREQ